MKAVVTGGGRGIGRAIALRCAAEGADVALAARSMDKLEEVAGLIEAEGRRALSVQVDLRDPEQIDGLRDVVLEQLGAPDVLIANSGIAGPTAPLWEVEPADWDETFAVNVRGTYLFLRSFLPEMLARGSGSLIVIGSMTGKRPLLARTPYAASKTALIGLVRTLAWEVGESGIRANLISPGPVDGERLERVIAGQSEAKGVSLEQASEELAAGSPLRRFVPAGDVAEAAVFLASEEAASVTGEDLNVSAGLAMY